jgi:hypothetical protein
MEPYKSNFRTDWPDLPPWWLVCTTRASAILGLSPQTVHRWNHRGLGPRQVPRSYLKPTKGDPAYYRYHDVKAWAAMRFGRPTCFADDTKDFIWRNCPWFSKGGPTIVYANQLDYYYKSDFADLRRGRKLRFFDEAFLMRFEELYLAQPKWTRLGIASEDLNKRLPRDDDRAAA